VREIISRLDLYHPDGPLRPGTIGAHLVASVSVAVATALRLAIGRYVEGIQFATFLPAVIITTLISGLGAGLFSVVLSVAAVAFFVLPPRLSFYVDEPGDVLALLLYAVVMLANVALVTGMRLAVERRKDQQVLQASKDRLQLALNAALLGWWQYDPLRRVILGDTRLKEIFDFTADETPLEEFVKRVHPDDLERVLADREAALNPADPKPYAHEYRIWWRDEVRWVESHGLAYFEGAGRERRAVSFIGTVADITQRRESVDRERLLMREINDRAKNMLSLVPGLSLHRCAQPLVNPDMWIVLRCIDARALLGASAGTPSKRKAAHLALCAGVGDAADGRRGKLTLADLGRADSHPSAFSKRRSRRRSPHR
jgi:PAS domain S-box-containing protein